MAGFKPGRLVLETDALTTVPLSLLLKEVSLTS